MKATDGNVAQLSDAAALTREMQIQARWRAFDRILKNCVGLTEITDTAKGLAKEAAAARDDIAIACLIRELPAFCRFKQISVFDANKLVEAVENIRAATWDDAAARAARQVLRAMSDAWGRLGSAVKRCREQATADNGASGRRILGLPAYGPADQINLNYVR